MGRGVKRDGEESEEGWRTTAMQWSVKKAL
jgi:hypothetical protein